MKRIALLATALLFATGLATASTAIAQSAAPDQVIQWNQEMLQLLQVPGAQPATVHPTRTMAITQLAVDDAVVAIVGGSRPYLRVPDAPRWASPDAAAAAAARTALDALLPSQESAIDAQFQSSLAQIGDGPRVRAGITVGERAAHELLAARANDGSSVAPPPFTPLSGPGEYQLTPPAFAPPVFTNWPGVTPFVLSSASEFRPPAPPEVTSARYATDFNEVKAFGEIGSTVRSTEQTNIGRFWGAAPVQNVWNEIAEMAGVARHLSLAQNARMFALLDTTVADGVIALYDAKYAYHRWRPVTAIQAADGDGNPATTADPNWTPLATTALDPSYPGAHAEISESASVALRTFFGSDRFEFALSNPNLPGVVRSFASFSQAANEAAISRIYAGQHFRYDEDAGQALGNDVASLVTSTVLGPEPRHARDRRERRHRAARR